MPSVIRGDDNFDSSSVGPSTDYGEVGTYSLLHRTTGSSTINKGSTYAGSGLRILPMQFPYLTGRTSIQTTNGRDTSTISGTWRAMTDCETTDNSSWYPAALFVRIS